VSHPPPDGPSYLRDSRPHGFAHHDPQILAP
jgi:hypothetical protein